MDAKERIRARIARFGTHGYGFVNHDGRDVFVHIKAVRPRMQGELEPGQLIEFSVVEGGERGPTAFNVVLIDE